MKKKVKIFILVCLLFLGISVTTTNTNFSQPAFASMGSTGGGHSTGGSSGGGTNYTSSDSSDSNNSSIGGIVGGFAILVLIFFSSYIIAALFDFIFKVRLRFEYDSNYLIKNSGDNIIINFSILIKDSINTKNYCIVSISNSLSQILKMTSRLIKRSIFKHSSYIVSC